MMAASSSRQPFVQKGFDLGPEGLGGPSSSFLADIPEQHSTENNTANSNSMHSPDAFIVPHFRSWSGAAGASPGAGDTHNHGLGMHAVSSADDLTDVLRNFINLDGNPGGSGPTSPKGAGAAQAAMFGFDSYRNHLQSATAFFNAFQQLPPHLQQQLPSPTDLQGAMNPQSPTTEMLKSPAPLSINNALSDSSLGLQTGTTAQTSIFASSHQGDGLNLPTKAFSSAFSPANYTQPLPSPSVINTASVDESKETDSRGSSRPNSTNENRGRKASPSDEKSRGRNSSAGRAPVQRPSRSRTRKPSYSRTISPGQTSLRNSSAPGPSNLGASSNTPEGSAAGSNGTSAVASPYLPGYPNSANQMARFGTSVPSYPNGSGSVPQAYSGNGYPFAAFQHHRRLSDTSTFAPSSFGADGSPYIGSTGLPIDLPQNAMGMAAVAGSAPSAALAPQTDTPVDELGEDEAAGKGKGPEDKRKKRRESHNAVERRRRDNINERITELANLIPEVLLDPTAAANGEADISPGIPGEPNLLAGITTFSAAQLAQQQASNRPNKGVILTKSVEYIRYLQQLVRVQAERNRELEQRVAQYEGKSRVPNNRSAGSADSLARSSSSNSPNSLLGHGQQLPTVEERLMEENQMSFEDLLGFASPAKVEEPDDFMR